MGIAYLVLAGVATVIVPDGDGCAAPDPDEIVVCRRPADPERFRLRPAAPTAEATGPPRAGWGLGGGVRMGVEASAKTLLQGVVSQRAMVTLKVPF